MKPINEILDDRLEYTIQEKKEGRVKQLESNRTKYDVIYDTLLALLESGNGVNKTRLYLITRCSNTYLDNLVKFLIECELIKLANLETRGHKNIKRMFRITQKGVDYINTYKHLLGLFGEEEE